MDVWMDEKKKSKYMNKKKKTRPKEWMDGWMDGCTNEQTNTGRTTDPRTIKKEYIEKRAVEFMAEEEPLECNT